MRTMKWTAAGIATGSLWPAAAGTLLAGVIPIRTPGAIGGIGFLSYVLPGAVLTVITVAGAHGTGRNPKWIAPVSILCLLVGIVILVFSGLTLAYVCFDMYPAVAAREGCSGALGAEWLAAGSIICEAACAALSCLALIAGIVAAARR
jgi:hypothetical protein